MASYKLTNKAIKDLSEIWEYTKDKWSEEQADRYYLQTIDSCRIITEYPELGRNYEGIVPSLFGLKSNKHIIFYRKTEEYIEITRILHERKDLKNEFK